MHMTFFRMLLTNLQKCLKMLFAPQSETLSFSQDFCLDLLRNKKYIYSKHFRRLDNKLRIDVHRGTSCKITAPTDKFCGNESKLCMTSQMYRFFQCIF